MYYSPLIWRHIRLAYTIRSSRGRTLIANVGRASVIPWIFCLQRVRLVIKQQRLPWIFPLRLGHAGSKIGLF